MFTILFSKILLGLFWGKVYIFSVPGLLQFTPVTASMALFTDESYLLI